MGKTEVENKVFCNECMQEVDVTFCEKHFQWKKDAAYDEGKRDAHDD